jgi:hypothetical protein
VARPITKNCMSKFVIRLNFFAPFCSAQVIVGVAAEGLDVLGSFRDCDSL